MTYTNENPEGSKDALDRLLEDPTSYFENARREVQRSLARESHGLSSKSGPRIGFQPNPTSSEDGR